jgi:hypothetical protein
MSEPNLSPYKTAVQKTLQTTIEAIRDAVRAKAVVVVVLHADGDAQVCAGVTPPHEAIIAQALRETADTIQKGTGAKVKISDRSKN